LSKQYFMMLSKHTVYYFVVCIFFLVHHTQAQIVNGNGFLKGNFVELGIGPCGTFGTSVDAPAGYHPRGGINGNERKLGFVADQGKDGWTVGNPNYCGDYYVPGSPEEGWGISIDGNNYNNNLLCDLNDIPGQVTSYRNEAENIVCTWEGSKNGIVIKAKTIVPKNKLYFLTEVSFRNTNADTVRNLYYMRNIDPDNEFTLSNNYSTKNNIVNQNPNAENKAVVTAEGLSFGCFIALGTKDCRAKVSIGGFANRSAQAAWNCIPPHNCRGGNEADEAISISFNLGNLGPNRTTSLKFVNVLNLADLDEAVDLTGPLFLIGNVEEVGSGDTSEICSSGPTILEVINTSGYDNWQWSPATGLNTTNSPEVICSGNFDTLTYTAFGQNSCGGTIAVSFTARKGAITQVPKSGPIRGGNYFCIPNTVSDFSIDSIPRARKYIWGIPQGASILSGDGTRNVTIDFGSQVREDSITVRGINVCGEGDTAMLKVAICNCNLAYPISPADTLLCKNDSMKISTQAIAGARYEWYRNGVLISGAPNSNSYWAKDTGSYAAIIYEGRFCKSQTQAARLGFSNAPGVQLHPGGRSYKCTGTAVTLSLTIAPNAPGAVTVNWFRNDSLILRDTNTLLPIVLPGRYTARVTNSAGCNGMANADTILDYRLPVVASYKVTGNTEACLGKTVALSGIEKTGDAPIVNRQWFSNSGGLIAGANTNSFTCDSTGIFWLQLTDTNGCISNKWDTSLVFYPTPVAGFALPNGCVNGNINFTDTTVFASSALAAWQWKKNGVLFSESKNPAVEIAPGNYQISLTVQSDKGCTSAPVVQPFLRYGKPTAAVTVAGICADSTTRFDAQVLSNGFGNTTVDSWSWSFGNGDSATQQAPSLIYGDSGTYSVFVYFTGNNCRDIGDSIRLPVNIGKALPHKRYNNIAATQGEPFSVFGAADGVSYQWIPALGLTNAQSRNTRGILNASQRYLLHVVNKYGCGRYDTLEVNIINNCNIWTPTSFSPNADGRNDRFRAFFGCLKLLKQFAIFDRWGKRLFVTSNPFEGWDGRTAGTPLDPGTYVWMADGEFLDGKSFSRSGTFVLVR
jgi:gliding motility-associated-like protein